MSIDTSWTPDTGGSSGPGTGGRHRISRLEWIVAGIAAVVLLALTIAEPDILGAPFENTRTLVFTFGGALLAAIALGVMIRAGVPPVIRVLVVGIPFVAVTWWLLSPFFIDDVVDDEFSTSIDDAVTTTAPEPATEPPPAGSSSTTAPAPPAGPSLLGRGEFVGLAGHEGTGQAGFFSLEDGSRVLRLEQFDIQNGPDLQLYVVPGAGQTDPGEGSQHLGALRGNVGDQTYDLPAELSLTPGDWTVLVWCDAFSVEFVAATVPVT
jgi:hypothetical protein